MTLAQMPHAPFPTPGLSESAGTPLTWPPTGRQIAWKPAGGFFQCPTDFLTLPWWLYREGHLPFLALRTWYSVLELPERRGQCTPDIEVHYGVEELRQILHVSRLAPVQAALHILENVGLLTWSASTIRCLPEPAAVRDRVLSGYQALQAQIPAWRTWVPTPRRLLRWLAREGTQGCAPRRQASCCAACGAKGASVSRAVGWQPPGLPRALAWRSVPCSARWRACRPAAGWHACPAPMPTMWPRNGSMGAAQWSI